MNPETSRARSAAIRAAALLGVGFALGAVTGCLNDDSLPLVSLSNSSGEISTATPAAKAAVVVRQAPPASLKESIFDRPSPRHLWVAGYWTWQQDKYQWTAGHWEMPPAGMDTWVAPRWEKRAEGYVFSAGFWR